ncbi:MAG: hypothetical protein PHI37_00110 [Candidatus Gracilibacteria bacterium]|nr:hypothetical protein [Candidatus Gracilibacteria bacterium]
MKKKNSNYRKNIIISVSMLGLIIVLSIFIYLLNQSYDALNNIFPEKNLSGTTISEIELNKRLDLIEEERVKKLILEKKNIQIINDAGTSGKIDACSELEDVELKNKCLDNGNLYNASLNNDIKYCDLVNNDYLKENCKDDINYNIALSLKDIKSCEKIVDLNILNKCKSFFVITNIENSGENSEITDCKTLTGDDRIYCENTINNKEDISFLNNALNQNDIKLCSSIKNKDLKITCQDTLNLENAISTENISLCNKILDSDKKEKCENSLSQINDLYFLKEAISKEDLDICEKIKLVDYKNQCYDNVLLKLAISEKNKKRCSTIYNREISIQCNSFFENSN